MAAGVGSRLGFPAGVLAVSNLTVVLGEHYRDPISGWEGVATCIFTYLHGCRRVLLSAGSGEGNPEEHAFDEPQLELIKDSKTGFQGQ